MIGRTHRSMNQIDDALAIQMNLSEEMESGKVDMDSYVYEEIAECLLLQNKADEAKPYFRKAHELISKDKWMQDNEGARLERMLELSK